MRVLAALLVLAGVAAALPAGAQAPASDAADMPAASASAPAAPVPGASAPPAAVGMVDGVWCGSGPLREFSLKLTQREQAVEGELVRRGKARTIEGRVEGNVLRTQATKVGALVLERRGEELKVTDGDGPIALVRGQVFRRTESGTCSG
jgi:hypothetical protein